MSEQVIDKVDKVAQAEWKLSGLCELCGSSSSGGSDGGGGHPFTTGCNYAKNRYVEIPELCLDKKGYRCQ